MRWTIVVLILALVSYPTLIQGLTLNSRLSVLANMQDEPNLIEAEVDTTALLEQDYSELLESMAARRAIVDLAEAFADAPTAQAVPQPPPPPPPPSTKRPAATYGGREPEPKPPVPNEAKYEAVIVTDVPALTKKQLWNAANSINKADAHLEQLHGITRDIEWRKE